MITFASHLDGYYDTADQFVADLRRRAGTCFRRQEREKAALTTIAAFEAHRDQMRERFLDAIGSLPEERTPLHAECTGRIERPGFTIEKILYQSQPEFHVTAALYVPEGLTAPAPAVLFVCGHSDAGKAYPVYQAVCVDLARNGFVVLAMDPPGQGERWQYWDPAMRRRLIGPCTAEHTHAGQQFTLAGASLARHFVWDAMRAIDYLGARPEVDAARIAVTGNSGGGTQTSFLMVCEPRLAAAAPCTFVMNLESYLHTGQPQDSEQIVRGAIAGGPDHDDYLTAMAPKPVLIGAAAYDFFPIEGTTESVRRARRIWGLYGAEDRLEMAVAPTTHCYSPYLRQAAVNFFRRHLRGVAPDFATDSAATLPEADLNVTPAGQVLEAFPAGRTVFDLNRERLAARCEAAPALSVSERRRRLAAVLGVPKGRDAPIYPRVIHESVVEGYPVEKVFFHSAPGITVAGIVLHPGNAQPAVQTDLVLLEGGTAEIPAQRARLERLLSGGHRLFVFDPRGIGAVESRPVNPHGHPHGSDFRLACDAMMLGTSTLGLRAFDVLRGYDYLRGRPDVGTGPLGLVGVGEMALVAYFAAALEEGFTELTFAEMLVSYRDLVETRFYDGRRYDMEFMAWGLLPGCDLPDLAPCLAPRPTRFESPRDANDEPLTAEDFAARFLGPAGRAGAPAGWEPWLE